MYITVLESAQVQNKIFVFLEKFYWRFWFFFIRRVHVSQWCVGHVVSETQRTLIVLFYVEPMVTGRYSETTTSTQQTTNDGCCSAFNYAAVSSWIV